MHMLNVILFCFCFLTAFPKDEFFFHLPCLLMFRCSSLTELEFPSSLNATERAYIHRLAETYGLKSRSRG